MKKLFNSNCEWNKSQNTLQGHHNTSFIHSANIDRVPLSAKHCARTPGHQN